MKKYAILFGLFLLFIHPVSAEKINFPPLTGQVIDQANVLTPTQKENLTRLISQDRDNQIVIAIIKSLDGNEGREYGIELARYWQIGQKGKDNGVLFLIATEDRYVGIEVGYGLEGILPDSLTGRIIREQMLPPLKENLNYYQALRNGTIAVMAVISQKQTFEENGSIEDILSMLFSLFLIYLILSGRGRGGGFGGGIRGGGFGGRGFTGGGGSFGGGGAGRRF